jgi:hypothetical protein
MYCDGSVMVPSPSFDNEALMIALIWEASLGENSRVEFAFPAI